MKLLGISAGRPMGNCEVLVKTALKKAQEKGCQVEFLRTSDYRVEPCTGCTYCVSRELAGQMTACSIAPERDDIQAFAKAVMEADGLIIASPSFNFSLTGRLVNILNREHCFMGQLKALCREKPKYAAVIGVAGSDRDNFLMPMLTIVAAELCGSSLNLIDQMLVEYVPTPASVAAESCNLERAAVLGGHLAEAVTENRNVYLGDAEEACPVCHGSHLQLRGGRLVCPMCDITAHVEEENGRTKLRWDAGIERSRWSEYGHKAHIDKIRQGHERADPKGEERRRSVVEELGGYLSPRKP